MTTIQVFDPPMCCSTGVCGPSVDPALATFAADLGWLSGQGAVVERHNLSQEPGSFAETDLVRELLAERGDEALPAIVVDGALRCSGRYPSRAELEGWALQRGSAEGLDALTAELVAIGAAVGASCEACFTFHLDHACRLGAAPEVIAGAVRVAQAVRDTSSRSMLEHAAKLLDTETSALRADTPGHVTEPATDIAGAGASSEECCGGPSSEFDVEATSPPGEAVEAAGGCCGGPVARAVPLAGVGAIEGSGSGCCG